jgi:hypothetical protein
VKIKRQRSFGAQSARRLGFSTRLSPDDQVGGIDDAVNGCDFAPDLARSQAN